MKFKIKDRTNFYSKDNIHLKYYKTMSLKKKKKVQRDQCTTTTKIYIYLQKIVNFSAFFQTEFIYSPVLRSTTADEFTLILIQAFRDSFYSSETHD